MIYKNLLETLQCTVLLLLLSYNSAIQTTTGVSVLLHDIKFSDDFLHEFDPRNSNSAFEFGVIDNSTGMRQDNAAFLSGKNGIVYMLSVPMIQWLPQSFGMSAVRAQFDSAARAKQPLKVSRGQILNVSLSFTCRTINVKLHKFPKGAVANASDDPRLASCALSLVDVHETGLQFSIQLTNQGVWAKYAKDLLTRAALNADFTTFTVYRRLASRNSSSSELVNARIEVDRRHAQQTRYFVNNELVWTVKNWGKLTKSLFNRSNDDYDQSGRRRFSRLVSYNPGSFISSRESDQPSKFSLSVENTRALDVADPNRFYDKSETGGSFTPALVRVTNLPGYYNPKVKFYDENSERYSSLWGQGVVAGLKTLRVEIISGGEGVEQNDAPNSRRTATNEANAIDSFMWRNQRRYATILEERALNGALAQ